MKILNVKKERAITLVVLVITIVLLLILAGISISILTNIGFFGRTKEAKEKSKIAQEQEKILLTEYEDELGKYTDNDRWDGKVNKPELMEGMTAIQFSDPTENTEGSIKKVEDINKDEWYNYDIKKWANAQTEDGSMWVWIPRYAYKIIYNDPNDKSKGGISDIVFLIGTTDNYIDANGNLQTAKRQTDKNQVIETDSTKTNKYTVHPAFTNESKIGYANGGWNKEVTGIWIAKFEAGYASGNNKASVQASSINYTATVGWVAGAETGSNASGHSARNYLDGIYGSTQTSIKYPTFQGTTYSMNYINNNDAYNISRHLTEEDNIYGFNKNITDSHLMKNSEWGMVDYLSESKYGLNGTKIYLNNVDLNNSKQSVYAVTGCASSEIDAKETVKTTIDDINNRTVKNVYVWNQKNGTKASTTGTIYGIYDMAGGTSEKMAAYIQNNNAVLTKNGNALITAAERSQYVMTYPFDLSFDNKNFSNLFTVSKANYNKNTKIYGDAIRETSKLGTWDALSWYDTTWSLYPALNNPFFHRGGNIVDMNSCGLFIFAWNPGGSDYSVGFRCALVKI